MFLKFTMIERFGEKRLYAENIEASHVLKLVGKNCLRMDKVKYLKELGHEVEIIQEPQKKKFTIPKKVWSNQASK